MWRENAWFLGDIAGFAWHAPFSSSPFLCPFHILCSSDPQRVPAVSFPNPAWSHGSKWPAFLNPNLFPSWPKPGVRRKTAGSNQHTICKCPPHLPTLPSVWIVKEEACYLPPPFNPQRNSRRKKKRIKTPISVCMCNSWPGGGPEGAGNIPEAKLPFQRNFSFFTSVPKLFKLLRSWIFNGSCSGQKYKGPGNRCKEAGSFQNSQMLAPTWKCVLFSYHLTIFTYLSLL